VFSPLLSVISLAILLLSGATLVRLSWPCNALRAIPQTRQTLPISDEIFFVTETFASWTTTKGDMTEGILTRF
jgi:hypothetical protein